MINRVWDGFQGHLTAKKWAIICKCSHDTANRDIIDLIAKKILKKCGDGRATYYVIRKENECFSGDHKLYQETSRKQQKNSLKESSNN